MNSKPFLTLHAVAIMLAASTSCAQFVEVEAVIDVTTWRYHEETELPLKSSLNFSVRCVVGTNMWKIESSRTDVKESLWFMDGKIIRQNAANQNPAFEEPGFAPMRRGMRSANVTASDDGYPAGEIFVNLPWFAFCSGPYLSRPGRAVPLLAPAKDRPAFGFKDQTAVFKDRLGLPQRVDLYTTKEQLKSEYRVQQSTNLMGWNFPTAFTLVQHEPNQFGRWKRQLTASGRFTAIRRAFKPELPEDIRERLEMMERYPGRRR